MVVKKCPICDQTLPVACKSCHCGHIFISRKQLMPAQDKSDVGDGSQRDQRLRPEIPKREIKDFDYDYGSKMNTDLHDQEAATNHESVNFSKVLIVDNSSQSTSHQVEGDTRSCITVPQPNISERKRGRPKGSKNKPKPVIQPGEETPSENEHSISNGGQNTDLGDPSKRRRGRPKGSKNKPKDPSLLKSSRGSQGTDGWSSDQPDDSYPEPLRDPIPHISKEKAISYSIVLSDINQKMMKQSSMNFV